MKKMTRNEAVEKLGSWAVETMERREAGAIFERWEAVMTDDFGNEIRAIYRQTEDSDWEIDHYEIEGDLEQRYWVQKERIPGDTFQDILPAGTSEEKAIEEARKEWDHLTPGEQRHSSVTLCHGLVDTVQEITDPFGFGYDTIDWEEAE